MSLNKQLETIGESDLQSLVDDKVIEGRTVDYKKVQTFDGDPQRDEFRKDVTALANANGGHLILGIREEKRLPVELCGFSLSEQGLEGFKTQIQEVLQSRIKPQLPPVRIHPVPLANGMMAAVIRVPKSSSSPHQVEVGKKGFEFWYRHDGFKQRMDIDEIRSSIMFSQGSVEQARNLRSDRTSAIHSGQGQVVLADPACAILHIFPFNRDRQLDLRRVREELEVVNPNLMTLFPQLYFPRLVSYNVEGLLIETRRSSAYAFMADLPETKDATAYLQIYRDGKIEQVWDPFDRDGDVIRLRREYELVLIESLKYRLQLLEALSVEPPLTIMLSIIEAKGCMLAVPGGFSSNHTITSSRILCPECVLTDYGDDLPRLMKDAFDTVWNAGNFEGSPNYMKDYPWAASARKTP